MVASFCNQQGAYMDRVKQETYPHQQSDSDWLLVPANYAADGLMAVGDGQPHQHRAAARDTRGVRKCIASC